MAQNNFQKLVGYLFGGDSVQLNLSGPEQPVPDTFASDHLVQLNLTQPQAELIDIKPAIIEAEQKSFDLSPAVTVIELGTSSAISRIERNANIDLFRNYAKYSTWVRAAIDYHRRTLGRARFELVPLDATQKESRIDKRVKAEVTNLLRHPNEAEQSYGFMKEQMIEDYLVIGHGCLELDLYRDLTPYGVRVLDGTTIGFVKNWDGTDNTMPRFVEFTDKYMSRVKRYLAHQQMFCLVNRPMSWTKLGFSHVEALHKQVMALLAGDDQLLRDILQPKANKLISLGEGVTKTQVDEFKYQIQQVRDALAVIGGSKDPKVLSLSGTPDEMKILDSCEWFVRQVAAIFGVSTAKLKLAVDTSRANTGEMYDDDLETIGGELVRIQELETATFINRYSYLGDVNLEFSYPILHRKDEKQQALIAKQQMGNQGWASWNESRSRTGEKALDEKDFPYANEPVVNTKTGPVPMSIWQKQMQELEKNIGKEQVSANPGSDPATAAPAAEQ
jgi:hypothetical protein